MLSFSRDPKGYIQDWICSQNRDLKVNNVYWSKSVVCGIIQCVLYVCPRKEKKRRKHSQFSKQCLYLVVESMQLLLVKCLFCWLNWNNIFYVLFAADDRYSWKSRGREKSRVLQPALVSRSRQSLLLLQGQRNLNINCVWYKCDLKIQLI